MREKEPLTDLQVELLSFIGSNPSVSYDELAKLAKKDRSTIMRNMGKLKEKGILKRVSSRKAGHWEILE